MKTFLSTTIIYISFLSVSLFSQNQSDELIKKLVGLPDDTTRVAALNEIAFILKDSSYEKSMEYLQQAEKLSSKLKYQNGIARSHLIKGLILNETGHKNEALDEFTKSLEIYKDSDDETSIALLKYYIGCLYSYWERYHIAIDHFLDALGYYNASGNKEKVTYIYYELGNAYRGIEDEERALDYYKLSLELARELADTAQMVHSLNNIGNVYSALGYDEKALEYYQLTLETNKNIGDAFGQSAALSNIGKIQIHLGNFKKALEYINHAQKIARDNNFVSFMLDNDLFASEAYEGMGLYKKSLELYKDYSHIKDSVYNAEKHEQIAEMQARYEAEKYKKENELLENKDKMSRITKIAIACGLFLFLIIGILIFSRLKSKIRKDRELMDKNKLIHEAQKKLVEAEQNEKKRLQEELRNKNNELTNFALHIIHKNELIQDIKSCVKDMKNKSDVEKNKTVNELILKLNQNLKTNKELQEFQMHVEKVNHDYFFKLSQKFPHLTDNEKRLSALLRLNLSSKEIASLNNISVKAVEMGRYRLRKRLNLEQDDNLSKFLQNL
ncbi:MAG: tetratricopeptide repeat protein [Bacteroidota bacterium]